MKRSVLLPGILAAAATAAWAGLQAPRVATIRESDGMLRPVWGLAANLVTGDALPIGKVQAAAFSDSAGIVLSAGAIRLLTLDGVELGAYPTAETKPILSISGAASTAVAWLASEGKLIRWNGAAFIPTTIDAAQLPGPVIDVYLRNDKQTELLLGSGSKSLTRAAGDFGRGPMLNESSVPEASGNAIQVGPFLLFLDVNGLEVESPTGATKTLPIRETGLTYERAGKMCIHLMSVRGGRQWLLHLDGAEPGLSEIPQVLQSANASMEGAK